MVGRRRHRFWQIFWSADDFFVEAPKLKISLTDPPIFMGFVIGEASGDGILSKNRRQKDAGYRPSFGRWSPDCRPIINFGMCYIVYNACIHINYEIYHAFILFWDSFHLYTLYTSFAAWSYQRKSVVSCLMVFQQRVKNVPLYFR